MEKNIASFFKFKTVDGFGHIPTRFGKKESSLKPGSFRNADGGSTRSESSEEDQAAQFCRSPSSLSLMLRDDPHNSVVLMLYLKHYSELLFSWEEKERSVQACKLVASAC